MPYNDLIVANSFSAATISSDVYSDYIILPALYNITLYYIAQKHVPAYFSYLGHILSSFIFLSVRATQVNLYLSNLVG